MKYRKPLKRFKDRKVQRNSAGFQERKEKKERAHVGESSLTRSIYLSVRMKRQGQFREERRKYASGLER